MQFVYSIFFFFLDIQCHFKITHKLKIQYLTMWKSMIKLFLETKSYYVLGQQYKNPEKYPIKIQKINPVIIKYTFPCSAKKIKTTNELIIQKFTALIQNWKHNFGKNYCLAVHKIFLWVLIPLSCLFSELFCLGRISRLFFSFNDWRCHFWKPGILFLFQWFFFLK